MRERGRRELRERETGRIQRDRENERESCAREERKRELREISRDHRVECPR